MQNHLLNATEQGSSYLLRARCGAFEGGPFKVATRALGVHVEDLSQTDSESDPCRLATGQGSATTSETDRNPTYPLQTQAMTATSGYTLEK